MLDEEDELPEVEALLELDALPDPLEESNAVAVLEELFPLEAARVIERILAPTLDVDPLVVGYATGGGDAALLVAGTGEFDGWVAVEAGEPTPPPPPAS